MAIINPTASVSWQEAAAISGSNDNNLQAQIGSAMSGSPLPATTVAAMTDHTRLYVYVGTESGYVSGHLYCWNGSTWIDSNVVYQATEIASGSVTLPKMGFRFLRGVIISGNLTVDYIANTISSTNNFAVSYVGKYIWTNTPQSISFTPSSQAQYVIFHSVDSTISVEPAASGAYSDIVLCTLYNNDVLDYDPSSFISVVRSASLIYPAINKIGAVLDGPYVIDTDANTLSCAVGSIVAINGNFANIPAFSTSFSTASDMQAIIFSLETYAVRVESWKNKSESAKTDVLLGQFFQNTLYLPFSNSRIFITNGTEKNLRDIVSVMFSSNKINIDTANNVITIPSGTILFCQSEYIFISGTVTFTPVAEGNGAIAGLYVNPENTSDKYVGTGRKSPQDWLVCAWYAGKVYGTGTPEMFAVNGLPGGGRTGISMSISDLYNQWEQGQKAPMLIIGDSTTDGVNTTSGASNSLGTDYQNTDAYPYKLEQLIKSETGNDALRVYNAGFASKEIGWVLSNFSAILAPYSDAKVCLISCGLNDSSLNSTAYTTYKNNLSLLCNKLRAAGIQPAILSTQATNFPGAVDGDPNRYRANWATHNRENRMRQSFSAENGIEFFDVEKFTQAFLQKSSAPASAIIPDHLHFGDAGHTFEAGLLFAWLCPRTIWVPDTGETIVDSTSQQIKSGVSYTLLKDISTVSGIKQAWDYTRETTTDDVLMDAYVFLSTPKALTAISQSMSTVHATVDGADTALASAEHSLGTLDVGLHHIIVSTGSATNINFCGLKFS